MLLFTIGSTSEIKQNALRRALKICGLEATVEAVEVDSGVNMQPCGDLETAQGAITRAEGARTARPGTYAIGIENGIHRSSNDSKWSDWAVIIMITPDGQTHRIDSQEVDIREKYVELAKSIGFDKTTVGEVLAQRYECKANDPHRFLSRKKTNREEILNQALIALFMQHLMPVKMIHPIKVRNVRRYLPIREVAPGVRVALFNILGDWELTEAAGIELAKLIPEGTEALLMPEGKAIALLHVMGMQSGLPTVVARKSRKPYMREPLISTTVKSITTTEAQTLYLDQNDVDKLRGKHISMVDDVFSSGGTFIAVLDLIRQVEGEAERPMAILTEGTEKPMVIALGHLPLF